MKLYHIHQNDRKGYDTYSDMVVCASSEDEARHIHPVVGGWEYKEDDWKCWARDPEMVSVKYIGEAAVNLEAGIVCSSYHAG